MSLQIPELGATRERVLGCPRRAHVDLADEIGHHGSLPHTLHDGALGTFADQHHSAVSGTSVGEALTVRLSGIGNLAGPRGQKGPGYLIKVPSQTLGSGATRQSCVLSAVSAQPLARASIAQPQRHANGKPWSSRGPTSPRTPAEKAEPRPTESNGLGVVSSISSIRFRRLATVSSKASRWGKGGHAISCRRRR